jgi:parvulin-like peptidyl-prolyl isomerase
MMNKKLLLTLVLTLAISSAHAQDIKAEPTEKPAPRDEHKISDADTIPIKAQLLDGIAATVFAQEGTRIITKSELERRSLDGQERTLDDLIYEQLMVLDAQKFKMAPDDEQIDKHLESVQRENNLTLDQLKTIFTNAGYSYEEGRDQFGIISLINQLLDFKIRSRLIVPEKEVVAYYNENPEMQDASYQVQYALVPFDAERTHEEQQAALERYVHGRNGFEAIDWQEPFWIDKNEMAENKKFIMAMQEGDISDPLETTQGFELFKLQEARPERLKTLDERYRQISDALRRPKYDQLLNEYKKQLMDGASVLYLN